MNTTLKFGDVKYGHLTASAGRFALIANEQYINNKRNKGKNVDKLMEEQDNRVGYYIRIHGGSVERVVL